MMPRSRNPQGHLPGNTQPPAGRVPSANRSHNISPPDARPPSRWPDVAICLFLALAVWTVFGQTLGFDFVNLDDHVYVYQNPAVQKGLTGEGFRWALACGRPGHPLPLAGLTPAPDQPPGLVSRLNFFGSQDWHPLTWLSYMLDSQFYGMSPGGYHLTNLLLHGAAAILLYLVLRRMTGFLWRSAFVAAVFAIHPLRAESVAWVAERKDVLSAFFFMLTLGAYVRWVRRPPSMMRYGAVVLCFTLGLMSKNMLVTLPFVLLLLDYWPLNRLSGFSPRILLQRVLEKIPLLVLTAGSCLGAALETGKASGHLPFGLRAENAVVSCVTYLWQMLLPTGLACFYPGPTEELPFGRVAGALGLLLAVSGAVWAWRKSHPWLVVGWLWYLGMMAPVIGIMQISNYAHADRYTYLPQIGLYLMLTWAVAEGCAGWRHRRLALGSVAAASLAALIFCARLQTAYWQNSLTLWTHALDCTSGNYIAHNNLGNALAAQNELPEAIAHYEQSLAIKPDYVEASYNLGTALAREGRLDEAVPHFERALELNPDDVEAHNNLGNTLARQGRLPEAVAHFERVLELNPDNPGTDFNLGNALVALGKPAQAIPHFERALQLKPDFAEAHYSLGMVLTRQGRLAEAAEHFDQAFRLKPDFTVAVFNAGNALAAQGQVNEAAQHFQQALALATAQGNEPLAAAIRARLKALPPQTP